MSAPSASLLALQPALDILPPTAALDTALHDTTRSTPQLALQACHDRSLPCVPASQRILPTDSGCSSLLPHGTVDTSLSLSLDPPSLPHQSEATLGERVDGTSTHLAVLPVVLDQATQADAVSDQHLPCFPSNTAGDLNVLSSLVPSPSQSRNASLKEECYIQGTVPGELSCQYAYSNV